MSLRTRLAIAFAFVAVLVAATMGSLAYVATANRLDAELDRTLADSVAGIVGELARGDGDFFAPDGGRGGRPGRDRPGVAYPTQVLDGNGDVRASTNDVTLPVDATDRAVAAATQRAVASRNVVVDGVSYRMVTVGAGNGRGAVQVARDRTDPDRVLASLAAILVAVGLGVALLAAVAGWFVARQVTRRLVRLTGVAEQVGATGRLDLEVPTGGRDEVGRLGTAFDAMLGRLARSKDDQQRLVQDAAHELRTPLTSLRTNVSLLRRFAELEPAVQQRILDDLQGETRELTHLVDEIVDLAIDAPAEDDAEPVVLLDVARTAADRAQRRTGRPVEVTGDGSTVTGNAAALERAVWNLLDNAGKFDTSGGPLVVEVHDGCVRVLDRGPGIAEEDLPHVFDRFYRATATRGAPGSGLGLAIVHEIALSHGGRVFAAPRPGGGAVVGFCAGPRPASSAAEGVGESP